ncbi:TonB-dependent receptor [Pedobacter sp.]|uniref:TonB-dependent receptor n=1 Tax=Pedobacter sp. TaxID=1411316 RepID=UPI003D7F3C12
MKHALLFVIILFAHSIVSAQTGNLSGKVINHHGKAVEGATVQIKSLNKVVPTNENGFYSIRDLSFGEYLLEVRSMDAKPYAVKININQPAIFHNIVIAPAGNKDLNEVSVTGKTEKKKIETSGFAVNVIETKEASLRNLQTNELLDRTVGVRVRQNGGLGSAVEYNLNGMSGRAVGVFIDGIEISTYGSSFNLNNIPPAMIERIEVYKGVLPAHLSGDFMGGAINVILKKDVSMNNITASVAHGSFNTSQADASGMYRNPENGFTAKASGFYTYTDNDYEMWGKFSKFVESNGAVQRYYRAKRFNDSYKSIGGRFEVGFTNVKWADAFLLGYNRSTTDNEIPHGQVMARPYVGRTSEAKASIYSLNYNKKNLFTNGLDLSVNGVYSDRDTYLQDTVGYVYNWDGNYRLDFNKKPMYNPGRGQQGIDVMTNINRKITTLRTNLAYDIFSGHRLSVNHVYYMVDRDDDNLLESVSNGTLKQASDLVKNVTAFNYEAQLLDNKLKTNVFLKYYQQTVGKTTHAVAVANGANNLLTTKESGEVSATGYGFAGSYAIVPNVILIGSAELAVRMPGDTEILGDPNENIVANFGIRPEASRNYNLGFRLGSFNFDKHKFTLSGNAFSRNVKDRIVRQTNTQASDQEQETAPFMNLGKSKAQGFEGELGYSYNNSLNVLFTFSKFNSIFVQGDQSVTGQRMTQFEGKQLPNEPFYTMNGNVQYRLDNIIQKKSVLNLFYNFGYVAPFGTAFFASEWYTTPKQISHDLGTNYRFPNKKFVISLDAKNILNAEVYDNFGVQKPGRAFYLKLNYSINNF